MLGSHDRRRFARYALELIGEPSFRDFMIWRDLLRSSELDDGSYFGSTLGPIVHEEVELYEWKVDSAEGNNRNAIALS